MSVPNVVVSPCMYGSDSEASPPPTDEQLEVLSISGSTISNISSKCPSAREDAISIRSSLSSRQSDVISIFSQALSTNCEDFLANVAPPDITSLVSMETDNNILSVTNLNGKAVQLMQLSDLSSNIEASNAGLKFAIMVFAFVAILVIVVMLVLLY